VATRGSTRTAGLRARLVALTSAAAPVGGGLALVGLSAYAVLGLAGHTLPPRDYAALGSLYLLTTILGPGVFVAVEQQTNREVSGRLAAGVGTAGTVRAAAWVSGGLAAGLALAVLACGPVLVPTVFADSWALLAATVLAVLGAAAVYLLRGVFAGQRRYGWYGASLAAEGLTRLLPCVALVLFGAAGLARFGFAFAAGCGMAAALTLYGLRRAPSPAPSQERPVRTADMAGAVGLLACASGLALLVANLGPVVLTSRVGPQPDAAALAASFVSLFVLVRVPVFLFAPVQAFLLPGLTAAAERGDAPSVRVRVRAALLAVAAVGVPGVLGAWLLGPWAARVFFHAPLPLPRTVAALLAVSTAAMMVAQILQPALVALGRHRAATLAWLVSAALFVALLFAPVEPLLAAVAAQLVAPVVVTVLMGAALRAGIRRLPKGQPDEATVTNSL
jgi:O-antigen/teichoic acid export membrane protein